MIGDAKRDLDASENNGILFYPIIPGRENESWKRFPDEGFDKFMKAHLQGIIRTNFCRSSLGHCLKCRFILFSSVVYN